MQLSCRRGSAFILPRNCLMGCSATKIPFFSPRCMTSFSISSIHPRSGMVEKTLAFPLLTFDSTVRFCSYPDIASVVTSKLLVNVNLAVTTRASRNWKLCSAAQIHDIILSDEDKKTWESCKQTLSAFGLAKEEQDKLLRKAFGQIHSPYWGEERKKEVPKFEVVNEILNFLKCLGLTDGDLGELLKEFPEVLGCSLEDELKANVRILEKEWGIKGKTLRNLLLRNPRALGYNIDCKGDCMAQCTRCWARF